VNLLSPDLSEDSVMIMNATCFEVIDPFLNGGSKPLPAFEQFESRRHDGRFVDEPAGTHQTTDAINFGIRQD
jgi:hypothetical protein